MGISTLNAMKACAILFLGLSAAQIIGGLLDKNIIMAVLGGAGLLVAIGLLVYIRKAIRSLKRAVEFCREIEQGNFESRLTRISGQGELGEMMWALNSLVDRMDAFIREAMASMNYVAQNKFYRRILETGMSGSFLHAAQTINTASDAMQNVSHALANTADDLEATVGDGVAAIRKGAAEILTRTQKMGNKIDSSSSRSVDVAKAARNTSNTVQEIAEATNRLSSSITEISEQVRQSTEIVQRAVNNADDATLAVQGLSVAAERIGQVVSLITNIAEQTNLLALNATVEASRAGDAGKGFAVVAGEVKNLANQTARATEEISQQISDIQEATQKAVLAIGETGKSISSMDAIASSIAGAVEAQGESTQHIADNMQAVAENADLVKRRIVSVNQGAAASYSAAIRVMWAARDLNKPAEQLDLEVKEFLNSVRKPK